MPNSIGERGQYRILEGERRRLFGIDQTERSRRLRIFVDATLVVQLWAEEVAEEGFDQSSVHVPSAHQHALAVVEFDRGAATGCLAGPQKLWHVLIPSFPSADQTDALAS